MALSFSRPTKDILWSILFLLFLYGVTHNPYTHPIPQPLPGNWSIQLMQHQLLFGIAGHNYLALKDQNGDIVSEFHGLATDPVTKEWKYIGTRETDILQVWEFDGGREYEANKRLPGIILFEGDSVESKLLWNSAETCKAKINQAGINYPPLGFSLRNETENSNSVAYTLALCMGVDPKHLGLITPGDGRNLLEK
jgi:hypothetical protein